MRRNRPCLALPCLALIGLGIAGMTPPAALAAGPQSLRVCAEPQNMPFSNAKGEGFENRLAVLVAGELHRPLAYVWTQDERAALAGGSCDLVMGVPEGVGGLGTTRPYYWSSYVLVSRADRGLAVSSLKDHRLRSLKIGVASVAGDALYTPPARVLSQGGLRQNLVAYPIDGGGTAESRGKLVEAVARGDVDIAAVWGPLAGFWIKQSAEPLTVRPIGDTDEFSTRKTHFQLLALQYEIAMGVRPADQALRTALDAVIERDEARITGLLEDYGVPLLEPARLAAAAQAAE